jgi:subtilisin family serine protease
LSRNQIRFATIEGTGFRESEGDFIVKKRHRARRSNKQSFGDCLVSIFRERNQRRRKLWTFERLEERQYFSATPASNAASAQVSGVLTPEQVTMGDMWWSFQQAADLDRYTPEQLASVTQWAVWTVPVGNTAALTNPYLSEGTISTVFTEGASAAEVIAQLSAAENVAAFYPLIEGVNAVGAQSPLDEPLFESQWHLRNTGQATGPPNYQPILGEPGEDINVIGAWNLGYTGEGVVVAVVDSGFQTNHPDLAGNWNAGLSTSFFGAGAGSHGTAVAGIIGAVGNNAQGGVGIAYNSSLVNIDIGGDPTPLNPGGLFLSAAVLNYRNDAIDIYNMSLGEAIEGRNYAPLDPTLVFALRTAIRFGRPDENGVPLGNIFVVSSGNDGGTDFEDEGFGVSGHWDSANYSGLVSSRYTIGVGAVDHDGTINNTDGSRTTYPEAGSSVLVVAPTGSVSLDVGLDTGIGSGIWTTDLTGNSGYNSAGSIDGDFLDDTNYTSRFNGTSAAAPMVSAVIALMLDANPDLTYRDVQEILLRSARQNDSTNESWRTNLYESWEPAATDAMGIPIEDAFIRGDIGRGFPSNVTTVLGAKPIDNYSLYQLPRFDNGAGYTVSDARGLYSEEYGWAHGVVDAELAVQLASQWTTKNQHLAPELSYTTFVRPGNLYIPPGVFVGPDGDDDRFFVPGVMVGGSTNEDEFHDFYQEFFADDPFSGTDLPFDDNGQPLPINFLEGFEPPPMVVEWVEVKLTVAGIDMNDLRVAIRSPDGTVSDLNMFLQTHLSFNINDLDQDNLRVDSGSSPGTGTFVFSTNRHWGERLDVGADVDPNTGNFLQDPDLLFNNTVVRTWDLIIENYGTTQGSLPAFEVIFHGTPLAQGSERISGKVGLDVGTAAGSSVANDGEFNFSRAIDVDTTGDGIPDTRVADPDPEPFGSNFAVRAYNVNNPDVIVDEFVTGADGNFYFDLAPGTYTIKVAPREGYTALLDEGLDPRYQQEWTVTIDPADNFIRTAGRQHVIDDDRDGVQDSANPRFTAYNDVDFLLSVDPLTDETVEVSGFVFADINGDGVFNNTDVEVKDFHVYADTNNSGAFEQGEPETYTDASGNYTLVVSEITTLQNIVIAGEPPTSQWLPTSPTGGRHTLLQAGGGEADNINFGFRPDPESGVGEPTDPGTLLGIVYNDRNANGVQGAGEAGVPGVRVYVDLNVNGAFDYVDANTNGQFDDGEDSEPTTVTNEFGGFFLNDIDPGIVRVNIVLPEDWIQTAPAGGLFQGTLPGGGQLNNILFAIQNQAISDYGDLPDSYLTTTAANGPSHRVNSGFRLGVSIDAEVNGRPSADALGDSVGLNDEDGVSLLGGSLVPGQVNTFQVVVSGVGGYLNAWIDLDGSGSFNDGEQVVVDADLTPGTHLIDVFIPGTLPAGNAAARFRWGTGGLNYFGPAVIGEVEDYYFPVVGGVPLLSALPGDYDNDGTVGDSDYTVWKQAYGSQNLAADGNGDGFVDALDYSVWRNNFGNSLPASASGSGGLSLLAAVVSDAPSTDADVETDLESSASLGLAFVPFETVASPLHSTPSALREFTLTSVASEADLELLDRVLAVVGSDDGDDADDSAVVSRSGDGESDDAVFALAFDEVTDWRYEL